MGRRQARVKSPVQAKRVSDRIAVKGGSGCDIFGQVSEILHVRINHIHR